MLLQLMAMALVPPVAVMLCNNPEVVRKYDLSSLLYVFSSGAALSLKTIQKIKELLPGIILGVAQGRCHSFTAAVTCLAFSPRRQHL